MSATGSGLDLTAPDPVDEFLDMYSGDQMAFNSAHSIATKRDICHRLAAATLKALCDVPSTRDDQSRAPKSQNEHALTVTARALEAAQKIIDCPCSKGLDLIMLTAVVASRALVWLQVIGEVRDPYGDVLNGTNTSFDAFYCQSLPLPGIALDAHVLRSVLDQLHNLDGLVKRYGALYCAPSSDRHYSDWSKPSTAMGNLLQSRLGYTIQDLESRLKNSDAQRHDSLFSNC